MLKAGFILFETPEAALTYMEDRIANVACVILPGSPAELFEGSWWVTDCIPNAIFVNQDNTIIELGYRNAEYSEVEDFLIASATELASSVFTRPPPTRWPSACWSTS